MTDTFSDLPYMPRVTCSHGGDMRVGQIGFGVVCIQLWNLAHRGLGEVNFWPTSIEDGSTHQPLHNVVDAIALPLYIPTTFRSLLVSEFPTSSGGPPISNMALIRVCGPGVMHCRCKRPVHPHLIDYRVVGPHEDVAL